MGIEKIFLTKVLFKQKFFELYVVFECKNIAPVKNNIKMN